jgi:hypothetical protein
MLESLLDLLETLPCFQYFDVLGTQNERKPISKPFPVLMSMRFIKEYILVSHEVLILENKRHQVPKPKMGLICFAISFSFKAEVRNRRYGVQNVLDAFSSFIGLIDNGRNVTVEARRTKKSFETLLPMGTPRAKRISSELVWKTTPYQDA